MHQTNPSSLAAPSPAPRPAAPPRPDHDARLPTYAQTQAASPSNQRFNRWGDWVDKRARERHRPDPSSSSSSPSSTTSPTLAPRHPHAPHQDLLPTSFTDSDTRPRSTSVASTSTAASAPGARSTLRLSRNSLLDRIGSRFDQGIPDEPLCAAPLPISHARDDRLILVGTAKGLYLVDLAPVSASAPLSTSAHSSADARTHCLWHGIGVHQLEVHVDAPDAAPGRVAARNDARTPSGCVVALVDVASERQVRTWSLDALVSLAMWRTMDEHSVPLELDAAHFSPTSSCSKHAHHHHRQPSSSAASSSASPSTSLRHPTFPFLKSAHHSPSKDARTPPDTSSSSSATSSAAASASASRRSLHLLDVDPAPAHGPPPPPAPSPTSAPAALRSAAYLAQPLEWATSCAALSLPKGAGTVVSCRLFRMPPPLRDPARSAAPAPSSAPPSSTRQWSEPSSSGGEEDDSDDDDDGYDDEPSARVRAERERRRAEAHRVLLVVVGSARSVFVYEMSAGAAGAGEGSSVGAGGGRSWTLTREFFAPSTPRFLNLVRTTSAPAPALVPLRATTSRPPPSSSYTGPAAGPPYPPDLHLVLGTSHRVVLVSLATSAVHEVDVPLDGTTSRRRAGSAASSRSETALGSSAGSSALGHRKTPSRAAAAAASAALGLGELRKSLSALVGGGSGGGRGAGPAPAGMDERELEGLVAGRRVDKGQGQGRQGGRDAEMARGTERARWTGCDVVAVHGPRARTSRSDRLSTSPTRRRRSCSSTLVLLTRGSTSYLVPSLPCPAPLGAPDPPLGLDRSPSSSSASSSPTTGGAPDPLALDVRHTLHHALAPVRHVVALVPPSGAGSSSAGRADAVPLVVCAFAETGLAVQEWNVSPDARLAAAPAQAVARAGRQQQLGVSESGPSAHEEEDEEEDDPPPDAATLDFARATRFLCELGGEGSGSGTSTGALFAVEGRGEWVLHRLGVRP